MKKLDNQEQFTRDHTLQQKVNTYAMKGKLRRIIAILSAFVLFFTMNTLKFEADTLQRIPMCGLEEHVHTDDCYAEDGTLICGLEAHEHTDACYQQRPVQQETTVLDEYMDLNSQVVLASPTTVSADDVDETVNETTAELGDDTGAAGASDNGLEVEYDLDDLYSENDADAVSDESADVSSENGADEPSDSDISSGVEYAVNGGTAFLSDVLRGVGLEASGILAVGEIEDYALLAQGSHIAVEPVEGVEGEFVIRVLQDFDRATLGVETSAALETIDLVNGVAQPAVDLEDEPADEEGSVDEVVGEPVEEADTETEYGRNTNETNDNSSEIIETEPKQTEVGEEETEVGGELAASVADGQDGSAEDGQEDAAGADADAQDVDGKDEDATQEGATSDAIDETDSGDASDAGEDGTGAQDKDAQDEDEQADGEQAGGEQADDEQADDEQADDEQADDEQADDEQADDEQADDEQADGEQAGGEQAGGEQADGEQADGEQAGEGAVVAAERRVDLDFTDYVATDDHTVFLYDAELGAVLVNTDEVQTADGVVVTLESAADEAQDEAQDAEQDEEAPAEDEEKAVLIITGDGEYEQGGVTYAVSGLVLPGETGAQAGEGDGAQGEDNADDDTAADDTVADDTAADDTAADDTAADETDDGAQSGEGGETAEAAERRVDLDFTDYIATDEHAVYLYDASMVAVLVNTAEIASVDGVAVGMPEAEAAGDAEPAENDADQAENVADQAGNDAGNTENDADQAENKAEQAEADAAAVLIITGDGEYALNGTTYAVTGLVLPEKTVGNDNITIATANDEATLLNVAPVFEETDEDYDDIFSLFTAAKDDPTLLARVIDLLGGVAYAEEDGEAGRELNVKVFNIALQDITTGEAVEPGTELHVETSLEKPIEGEDFALYHIADGKAKLIEDAVVVEDGKAVGLNFNTVSLDKFALVYYTVNVTVEEKTITVGVDFTDVVENGVDFDSQDILTALDDGVAIDVASLLAGETGDSLIVEATETADVDVENLAATDSEGGVAYADGAIKVTGDGSVTLTDSVYTIHIHVTNYQKLVEKVLQADGVTVEVIEGEVPAGSTVSYEALSDAHTEALVEEYREIIDTSEASGEVVEAENTEESGETGAPDEGAGEAGEAGDAADRAAEAEDTADDDTAGEDGAEEAAEAPAADSENTVKTETTTGYTAFDVSIAMPEGGAFTEGGQFAVTVDHAVDAASLVPEGAVIDSITYELFHIHNGEATQIEDVAVEDGQVSFTTDGFSEYVIRYTVEFHNGDTEVVIKGESQVLLSTLIEKLDLKRANGDTFTVDEVEKVEFVNPELFTVEEKLLGDEVTLLIDPEAGESQTVVIETAHDFVLTSRMPFDADQMILTMKDDAPIEVDVTDNINDEPAFTLTANANDQKMTISLSDGTSPVDLTSDVHYYIHAYVQREQVKYAALAEISGGSVTFGGSGTAWASFVASDQSTTLADGIKQGEVVNFNLYSRSSGETETIDFATNNWGLTYDCKVMQANDRIDHDQYFIQAFSSNDIDDTASIVLVDQPKYTAQVKFFNSDSNIVGEGDAKHTEGVVYTNAAVTKHYYAVASLVRDEKTLWAVQPILTGVNNGWSETVEFRAFKSANTSDSNVYYLKDDEKPSIRLYKSDSDIPLNNFQYALKTGSATEYELKADNVTVDDQPEDNYVFGGGEDITGGRVVHYKHSVVNYKYKIRLRFDENSTASIKPTLASGQQGVHYYVFASVEHTTGTDYSYAYGTIDFDDPTNLPIDEEGYYYFDYEFPNWKTYEGSDKSDKFTGQEPKIEVCVGKSNYYPAGKGYNDSAGSGEFTPERFVDKNSDPMKIKDNIQVIKKEGDEISTYTIHYDTRVSRGVDENGEYGPYYSRVSTTRDSDGELITTVWCYDQITLTSRELTADYDYAAILGPNLEYGIVAEHLFQGNHLQTNFAVNHFSAHNADVRPDLSGDNAGNIVIGQFNVVDGDRRNAVGNVAYDPTWGRLKVGKPLNGTLMVYVDRDSGYPEGSVYDNDDQTIVVKCDGASLSENIVEPGIDYMKRISAELLSKPSSLRPDTSGSKVTIDTTNFDDYATIYLNGDDLEEFIETSGGLNIVKRDNQVIVFNFFRKTNDELNIRQFTVNGQKTESPEATGTHQNTWMDDVARHIVWNLAGRLRQVNIDTAGGIFLQPNDDSNIDIQGTTAGWIVSDGYVYNSTAEWHNVYEEMPDAVKVTLNAVKYLDNKVPTRAQQFSFKLEKLKWEVGNAGQNFRTYERNPWEVIQESANNVNQKITFDTIEHDKLDLGWNIFRITETKEDGNYIYDSHVYYAAVLMERLDTVVSRMHNIDFRISRPQYYSSFNKDNFYPLLNDSKEQINTMLTGVSGRVDYPEFNNQTINTGLTLMKKVDGTDATNTLFTFKIRMWVMNDNTSGTPTNRALTDKEVAALTHKGVANTDWHVTKDTEHNETVITVPLRNGRKVTIGGLTEGMHYHVEETAIGSEAVSELGEIKDHYQVIGVDSDDNGVYEYSIEGKIENATDAVSVVYNNKYTSEGHTDFTVHKTMKDKDNGNAPMDLVAGQFKFTLSGGGKTLVGYNDADGNVVFGELDDNDSSTINNNHLSFTQEDMAGAKRNNQGYLEKEITYVITESEPNPHPSGLPADFDYNKVIYDKDKTIALVLTDMGNGTITVTPKNGDTALGVQFDNGYMEKATATLEGEKTLEGRQLNKAEFLFDAKLIKVDEYNVSAEDIAAEMDADRATILRNKRQQADPIDVIGHNEEKHTPDEENGTTYTGNITFPTIYYTAAGTYVYEITENTTNMPVDARQKEESTKTYYAKVVVSDLNSDPTVTYYNDSSLSTTVTEPSFENETQTINFTVTKEVRGEDGEVVANCTDRTITFEVYRDGSRITVNDSMLTSAPGVEIVDGSVKLTGGSSGWPTAQFHDMVPGRYTVKETEWTGFTSGTPSITYQMTVNGNTSSSAIREDESEMKIVNTESTDKYTRIKVKKEWKDNNGQPLNDVSGSVQFILQTEKTTGPSGGEGESLNISFYGGDISNWPTGKSGKIGSQKINVIVHCKLSNCNDFFDNKLGTSNGPRVDVKYCSGQDFTGSEELEGTYYPTASATKESYNATTGVNLIFNIPIKDFKCGGNDPKSMKLGFQIGDCSDKSLKHAEVDNVGDPVVSTSSKTITLSSANGWEWDGGYMPVSVNGGQTTYRYRIKEVKPGNAEYSVVYNPENPSTESTDAGWSGWITKDSGSGIITMTNKATVSLKGALKITKKAMVGDQIDPNASDTFTFTIAGKADTATASESHTLKITFQNGAAYTYRLDSGTEEPVPTSGAVLIGGLVPGEYTVTETDVGSYDDGVTIIGGKDSSADTSTKSVTLVVYPGDNQASKADAQVIFENHKAEKQTIEVTKKWIGVLATETDWPKDSSGKDIPITLTLKKRINTNEDNGSGTTITVTSSTNNAAIDGLDGAKVSVAVKADDGYKITISGLEKNGSVTTSSSTTVKGELEWYVVETQVAGYGVPQYTIGTTGTTSGTREDGAHNGDVITNEIITYAMPSTGGPGTSLFYILGSILTLVAAVLLITKKRSDGAGI